MKNFKSLAFLALALLSVSPVYSSNKQENQAAVQNRQQRATALREAVLAGDVLAVQKLIEHTPVNIKDAHGKTALHYAVARNHLEIAKLLLENGARSNIKDNEGHTPLHTAVQLENPEEALALLLQFGARPNILNKQNLRAIDLTTNEKIAALLIAAGSKQTSLKNTPEKPAVEETVQQEADEQPTETKE